VNAKNLGAILEK